MKISANYSMYSNQNMMHNAFKAGYVPKKIASMAVLSAIAGMGAGYDSWLDDDEDEEVSCIGIRDNKEHSSPKVEHYLDQLM